MSFIWVCVSAFFKLFAVIQVNIIRFLLLIKNRRFGGTLRLRLNWVWQPWFKETQELNCKWVVFYWSFVWLFSSPTGLCNMNLSARVRLLLQWHPDLNCALVTPTQLFASSAPFPRFQSNFCAHWRRSSTLRMGTKEGQNRTSERSKNSSQAESCQEKPEEMILKGKSSKFKPGNDFCFVKRLH